MHELALDETTVFTWDAEARTLSEETFELRYDESGRLLEVEVWVDGDAFLRHIDYDARGIPNRLTYTKNGGVFTASSWDQTNVYDGVQLLNSFRNYRDGKSEQIGYGYVDGLPEVILHQIVGIDTTRIRNDFGFDRGRPSFFKATVNGKETDVRTATYDDMGRLVQTDWDDGFIGAGLDGSVENREKWFYDDEGRIVRHEVDFQSEDPWPAPLDGVADRVYEFEPECAAIAVSPYYVYGVPSWLFPYASSAGWLL